MVANYSVDFCTFCFKGDAHRLHAPGQLKKQVESNDYPFDAVCIVHQGCDPYDYANDEGLFFDCDFAWWCTLIDDIDQELRDYGIDLDKPQYQSPTDKHHSWKYHVVNHVFGIGHTNADYIVFADNDCWIVSQPDSWVARGIEILKQNPDIFIVSPNDGEPERKTQTMSQQMFLVNVNDFRQADLNQPGWDGNVHIQGGPFPEYWSLLEGRMELYCRSVNKYRYVMPPEYRYWHHNRLTADGMFETDLSRY